MGIRLTTPEPTEIAQDAAIVGFQLNVPHNRVGDALAISRDRIKIVAKVITYNALGSQIDSGSLVIELADMPTPAKAALKDLYEWLEGQAQAQGLIGEGVAEPIDTP